MKLLSSFKKLKIGEKDIKQLSLLRKVKIGHQIWMAENLNADHFHNSDIIPEVKSDLDWEKAGEAGKPAHL
jgi:hypothetical protein